VIHNKSLSNGAEDISFSFVKNDNFCKEVNDLETHLSTYKQRASKLLSIINMISDFRNSYDKNNQKILQEICNKLVIFFGNDKKYSILNYPSGTILKRSILIS